MSAAVVVFGLALVSLGLGLTRLVVGDPLLVEVASEFRKRGRAGSFYVGIGIALTLAAAVWILGIPIHAHALYRIQKMRRARS
jgi:hypothetical protein